MLNIQEAQQPDKIALLHLGFRPFFLGAGLFAILSMLLWSFMFVFGWPLSLQGLTPSIWHSHEMVYGYAVAVIAGFLLTAVRNWTGVNTLNGKALLGLFLLWVVCRCLPFLPIANNLIYMAVAELLFLSGLFLAILIPVLKVKQWKQIGILTALLLFILSDLLFYLSALGKLALSQQTGIYLGFYLVILMILMMTRRVMPFFIEKGVGYPLTINNWLWLDILSLIVFVVFALTDVLLPRSIWVLLSAGVLLILHSIRLVQWHDKGIWQKPLLWVLYIAYAMLVMGFALKLANIVFDVPATLALHLFAVGGITMMSLGMMARIALGHTGRNVFEPPKIVAVIFILILLATLTRVVLPLISMDGYKFWILLSQVFWISSFSVFVIIYAPILIKARVDGQYG